jgi:glycosyltransferase involved in cell wall biosynthesis
LVLGPVAAVLAALRNRSLRRAEAIVVVGELMAHRVEAFGIAPARVHVIPNWCDDETIKPLAEGDNPLRKSWHLTDKFVVAYSGNLGRAHDYQTIVAAAERLRDEPRITFLVIGGGKHFDDLITAVKARGLECSFQFRSYQQRALLPYSLSVGDVHWLSLDPALEGLIVPSKFYAIAAAGKPMVMIGDADGEVGRLIRRHRCGITVAPGDAAKLADTLRHWSEDSRGIGAMGARARQMLDAQFTRRRALEN